MRLSSYFAVAFGVLALASSSQAVTITTVPVGNAGNPGDSRYGGYGSVGYDYRIATTEVTNAQYVEFLNGVDPMGANTLALYNSQMTNDAKGGITFNNAAANGSKYAVKPGRDNNPVIFARWYSAVRFANWLTNGQGSAGTESGSYTLVGGSVPTNPELITRNPGAIWVLPTENEWYKAAYHKNNGVTGNYWDYATGTNSVPFSDQPLGGDAPTQSNTANFFKNDNIANNYDDGYAVTGSSSFNSTLDYLTDVGAYSLSTSPYGTFDQSGNVSEWNETLIGSLRGFRGGSWGVAFSNGLRADFRGMEPGSFEDSDRGFRMAMVPEPASAALLLTGAICLVFSRMKRKVETTPGM